MSHTARLAIRRPTAASAAEMPDEQLSMRMLRHQTKNALQRLIAQIDQTTLRSTPAGSALADELERRIRLSARISDALFGLTAAPAPFNERLDAVCRATVDLMTDDVQSVGISVLLTRCCPARLESVVLLLAQEMVTNAAKHGLHMRLGGRVEVVLRTRGAGLRADELLLTVRDDGWGPVKPGVGEGLATLGVLAAQHGGRVRMAREAGWTVCEAVLPLLG